MKKLFPLLFIIMCFKVATGVFLHNHLTTIYVWNNEFETEEINQIKVVSYNIRYGKGSDGQVNLHRTIATLKELDAHIISLQEVERYSFRSNFYDQVKKLANELNMDVVYYPSLAYPGFYYGNVILSKFPIVDTDVMTFQTKGENRTALIATVLLPYFDEVYVINTHLGLNKQERLADIEKIHHFLSQLNKPILLMGDLNSTPSMGEYHAWKDILKKSNEKIKLQTFSNEDWQIDYIFHSEHFFVNEVLVHESNASDHYPIIASFSLIND